MHVDVARARELFLAVLELPAAERAAYLDSACAGDAALRQRLDAMLRSHADSGELLPRPPAELLADSGATEANATGAWPRQPETPATPREQPAGEPDGLPFLAPPTKPGHLGRLGHYEVHEVIGKGGFGVVLRAFDEKLHRVVAIKVLAPAYATVGSARERFIREARAAAAVKNEHVVAIYNVQDEGQPPYLVMELIDGVTLQEKLDKKGPLSVKEILRIGMQMAEGLAAAHKQGLVHRDVKPANILLENGVERVKLTDFGLARAVDDASLSQSGTVAGTPMYMSPEQAEGLALDHRSDLFSLGSVLYAMCTGHPPFRASGTHAVLKRVIEASPRPVREVNPEIPDWLAAVGAKLHAREPGERFQTAQEVADLLGQYLAHVQQPATVPAPAPPGLPGVAPAPPASVPASRFWGLVSRALLFGAFFGGLVGLLGYWFGWFTIHGPVFGACDASALAALVYAVRVRRHRKALVVVAVVMAYLGLLVALAPRFLDPSHLPDRKGIGDGRPRFVPVFGGPGWRRLYDGKSYAGWKSLGNSRVGNPGGELVLFHGGAVETKETLPRNFHLRMEVKLLRGHGTVRFHTPGGTEKLEGWFLHFSEAPHAPGLLKSELRNVLGNAAVSSSWEGWARLGEWFYLEIITVDRRTDLRVNGQRYEYAPQLFLPAAGVLRLWNNGHGDSAVVFRNIEIKELPPADKDDKERLQGRWVAESIDNGRQLPRELCAQLSLTVTGGRMRLTMPQPIGASEMIFHLDVTATPKKIDVIDVDRKRQCGIYRFDGDRLVLCLGDDDDKSRPTEFTSKGRRMVAVFKRAVGPEPDWVYRHNGTIAALAVSPNGKLVAVGWRPPQGPDPDYDGLLLDRDTGRERRRLKGPTRGIGVSAFAFSPDSKRVAGCGGGSDRKVYVWDTDSGELLHTLVGHKEHVSGIAFSPGGELLLTAGWDRTLLLWDAQTGKELALRVGDPKVPAADWSRAVFLPQRMQAVVGGLDKLVLVEFYRAEPPAKDSAPAWGVRLVREFASPGGRVGGMALSPNGQRLLTSGAHGPDGRDGRVRLWDVATGQQIRAFDTPAPPKQHWLDVAFLPDGKRFVTASPPKGGISPTALALWDADGGKVLQLFPGHTDLLIAVAVTPDGKYAVSGGADQTVRLWELP